MKSNLNLQLNQYESREYFIDTKGMQFCIQERGNPESPPVLLIMGLACQLTHWPDHFINDLVELGYRVISFDNRDVGLSEKMKSTLKIDTRIAFLSHKFGMSPQANYTLHDMANDTANIIESLDLKKVHLVGVSMGGMIAQLLAANHADKIASLTAMMSSTNSPKLPLPELSLMLKLGKAGMAANDIDSVTKRWVKFTRDVQSPDYPTSKAEITKSITRSFRRSFSPGGTIRQLQAILATGSIEKDINKINLPTQVIHGLEDPLLKPECAKAIVKEISNAKLHLIPGMGHDLPEQISLYLTQIISQHIKKAEQQSQ